MLSDERRRCQRGSSLTFANMSAKLLIVILAVGFIVASVMIWFGSKSYDYNQYVCMNCGIDKNEDIGKYGPVKYRSKRTLEDTEVSAALQVTNCSHTWLLYRFGRGRSNLFIGGKLNADGGSPAYMIRPLLNDQRFAEDLVAMPRASAVWSNVLVAIDSNRDLNDSLGMWWQEGLDRGSFSNWWTQISHVDVGPGIGEQDGTANGGQPIGSETYRPSSAAGSRR